MYLLSALYSMVLCSMKPNSLLCSLLQIKQPFTAKGLVHVPKRSTKSIILKFIKITHNMSLYSGSTSPT